MHQTIKDLWLLMSRLGSSQDLLSDMDLMQRCWFFSLMCNSRSPGRGEETVVPHPIWALQLQDSVERARAGDGVHRRGTVSEGIQPFSGPKTPR